MQAASKFTFDLNFSPTAKIEQGIDAAQHEAELAAARESAYQEGFEVGCASIEAKASEKLAQTGEKILGTCEKLLNTADVQIRDIEVQSIELSLLVARKLAPGLIAQQPMAELKLLLQECLGDLQKVPHLAVRVNEDYSEGLKAHLDKLAYEKGFEGRVIVLGEPDIALGDGSIEWAEGGLTRSLEEIENSISANVAHFLAVSAISNPENSEDHSAQQLGAGSMEMNNE